MKLVAKEIFERIIKETSIPYICIYIYSSWYILGTVPGIGDVAVNKIHKKYTTSLGKFMLVGQQRQYSMLHNKCQREK